MKLATRVVGLKLRHTFTIARGSEDVSPAVVAELEHGGLNGLGEARPDDFYGETPESVQGALARLSGWFERREPLPYRHFLEQAALELGASRAALCALDLAVHDWIGKKLGAPLHRLLGLDPARLPATSFTIGIDTIERMVAKLREARGLPIIKVKLGTPNDIEIVRALRRETPATLRVDANCAWSATETIEKSRELEALGVEFIEQPLPPGSLDAMEEVYAKSALPLIADESSVVPADVPHLHRRFHGINIKLVKCGGIQPALRMVDLARAFDLKVMFGCMIESSLAATAAAQIGALADYLDLDSPLLITNDPYRGLAYDGGRLRLPPGPGLGVEPAGPGTAGKN
jgi:L-alanine-DL-glutamate epimerase-like enolase superfamily enzyme